MDDIPQWAMTRAGELAGKSLYFSTPIDIGKAFARYIAEHEQPPVDPLLIEAMAFTNSRGWNGDAPDLPMVKFALAALHEVRDQTVRHLRDQPGSTELGGSSGQSHVGVHRDRGGRGRR